MGRPSKKVILKAIEGSGGIISTVARRLDVAWSTASNYCNLYEETRQALKDELEKIIDMAEGGLFESVKDKNLESIKWLLARKGKKRGYSERTEVTGADGENLEINLYRKEFKSARDHIKEIEDDNEEGDNN